MTNTLHMQVQMLEEENTKLRRRVSELEHKLACMQEKLEQAEELEYKRRDSMDILRGVDLWDGPSLGGLHGDDDGW